MKAQTHQTIQRRLLVFNVAILSFVIVLFALVSNAIFRHTLTIKARNAQIREASLVSNSLDIVIENINEYLLTFSVDPAFQQILKENPTISQNKKNSYNLQYDLARVLNNKTGLNFYIDSCAIMSQNQELFGYGEYDISVVEELVQRQDVAADLAHNKPRWYGPLTVRHRILGNQTIFVVAKPVMDLTSPKQLGVVFLFVKESALSDFYRKSFLNSPDFYVVNQENIVVSAQDKEKSLLHLDQIGPFLPQTGNYTQDAYTLLNTDGEKLLVTINPLNRNNWAVISTIPIAQLTQELQFINSAMVVLGVVAVLLSVYLTYLLARSVSRPIVELVGVMTQIDDNTLDLRIPPQAATVEIYHLRMGFNSLMDRINLLMQQIYIQQKQRRTEEFHLLQLQIKPHFLYNSLDTIHSLVGLNLNAEAALYVKALAGFYRISLSGGNEIITLQQELDLTGKYLAIQHIRYIENFDYEIDADPGLDHVSIPKLTLQPIVENAIYHGIKPSKQKTLLKISTYQEGQAVKISVTDYGVGIPAAQRKRLLDQKPKDKSFGLYAVNNRLQLLYGNEWGLSIVSEIGAFTQVIISIPMQSKEGLHD